MSKYNPKIHHRRSIRLKGYNYSREGLYYITICCHQMACRFGYVEDEEMQLNEYGKIAYDEWVKLPERFPNIRMDVFEIMPNHMHGIFEIVGASFADGPSLADASPLAGANFEEGANDGATARVARTTMGDVVGAYKSLVANGCLEIYKARDERMGKLWHRNLWESIIRTKADYERVAKYIRDNPKNWKRDKFNGGR